MKKSALFIFIAGLLSINGFGQVTSTGCTILPNRHSSAIGYQTEALGYYSLASGYKVKALADYSYIFGSVPTGITGYISDITENNTPNSFMIVFEGKPLFFARLVPKTPKDGNEDSDDDPESGEGKDIPPYPTPNGTPTVGIGTADLQETLDVRGNIIADTVKVKRSIFLPNNELSFTYDDWGIVAPLMTLKRVGIEGRVGIGTNNPEKKLHVQVDTYMSGKLGVRTNSPKFELDVNGDANADNVYTNNIYFPGSEMRIIKTAPGAEPILPDDSPDSSDPPDSLGSRYTKNIVTFKKNGFVGIGTTLPETELHVNGGLKVDYNGKMKKLELTGETIQHPSLNPLYYLKIGELCNLHYDGLNYVIGANYFMGNPIQNGLYSYISFHNGNAGIGMRCKNPATSSYAELGIDDKYVNIHAQLFFVNGNSFLNGSTCITGDLGIGTLPIEGYRLGVNGKINCTELVVTATVGKGEAGKEGMEGWPDYVFTEDYSLRSLDDVASYIEENKHLPEIPSAAEVVENGVNVGEMNALLLKKVEELTLYILQQNNDIQSLKEEVRLLKERR